MNMKKLLSMFFGALFTLSLSVTNQSLISDDNPYQYSEIEEYSPIDEGGVGEDILFTDDDGLNPSEETDSDRFNTESELEDDEDSEQDLEAIDNVP